MISNKEEKTEILIRGRHLFCFAIMHRFQQLIKNFDIHEQAYARIGMAKEAADAASPAQDK